MNARDRLQKWHADRDSRATRILAMAGLLLLASVMALVLVVYASQPAKPGTSPETAVPAAQNVQQVLGQQLHIEPASVQIVQVDEQSWPDACLGAPYADQMCAQVQTPGYRITLAIDGSQYTYHTDLSGVQVRLVSAPEPTIGERIVTWLGSDDAGCQTLEAGAGGVAFGHCGRALMGVPYSSEARPATLAQWAATYRSFETETPAGTVQFVGVGEDVATEAEQRMIAEWARLVHQEAESGRSSGPSGLILAWHREGGLAGFCDDVTLHVTGDVYVTSCQGEQIGHLRLDPDELATLYAWADTMQPFEYEEADPAVADAMTVRLVFSGTGEQLVQAADRQRMMDLVQSLYNEAWMLASDTSSVCPTPGASQQLLVDQEAAYCLLYPAEYSLVQAHPRVTEIVLNSVMNHTQPRLSIGVEESAGRNLDEVVAQMESDYVPVGWEVSPEYITVDGVKAVVLDNLPGQDLNRRVAFIDDGRLYTVFLAPIGDEGSQTRRQAEMLYRHVLDSFRFLHTVAPTPSPGTNVGGLEPLQFAPGSSSATVSGTVTALAPKQYLLQGLGGQTMTVELETAGLQTYITVLTPSGENMAGADGPIHQWSGRLPVDGNYVVEVINTGQEPVDFWLTTTIPPTPASGFCDPGTGEGSEPVEVLLQLDWEGGFGPPELSVPFGRVPAFTLLADGRVFYVDQGDAIQPNQEELLVAQLAPDETQALVQQVLDLGFERLESYLDWCQELADGTSQCVADAGYSILRVRLPAGNLREIRNWADFANDPEALNVIRSLLAEYRHPEAQPYVPDQASLFIGSIPTPEGVPVALWPLNRGWLEPPAPAVEQWAGVLADGDWEALLMVTSRNMGAHYFRDAGRFYQVVLVPWLPGTDYTDLVAAYRWP